MSLRDWRHKLQNELTKVRLYVIMPTYLIFVKEVKNVKTELNEKFEWKNSCKVMGFYRRSLNLTKAKLAILLGVTDSIVGWWERGIKEPKISNFVKLARVLGVSELDLLYPSEEVQKKIKEMNL